MSAPINPILVVCPNCGREIEVNDDLLPKTCVCSYRQYTIKALANPQCNPNPAIIAAGVRGGFAIGGLTN